MSCDLVVNSAFSCRLARPAADAFMYFCLILLLGSTFRSGFLPDGEVSEKSGGKYVHLSNLGRRSTEDDEVVCYLGVALLSMKPFLFCIASNWC